VIGFEHVLAFLHAARDERRSLIAAAG